MTGAVAAAADLAGGACARCGTQLAPRLLSCPSCHALVHAARLKALATEAEAADASGDVARAARLWHDALTLLPPTAQQHAWVSGKVAELTRRMDAAPDPADASGAPARRARRREGSALKRAWAAIVAPFVILLGKLKFLLLGLAKAKTLLSMLAYVPYSSAVYGGWRLGIAVVGSIYVHEMGHVAAIRRYGMEASAPMFIPGVGAFVALKHRPLSARQDARIGLAGPLWGLAAALVAYGLYLATGTPLWGATAHYGAALNLLNLAPIAFLDGSRGFRPLSRRERLLAVLAIALTLGAATQVAARPLQIGLAALGALALIRAVTEAPGEGDRNALGLYVGLVLAFTALTALPVGVS